MCTRRAPRLPRLRYRLPRLRQIADAGARSGPLQTRASVATKHAHVHVRRQVRAWCGPRIRRGPEARGQGAMSH